MKRFSIKKCPEFENQWICIDKKSGFVCTFEHGNFFGKKVFSFVGAKLPDYLTYKKVDEDMGDWLLANHNDKIR